MAKLFNKHSVKKGAPPGTLVYIGEEKTDRVRISIIDYDESHIDERELHEIEECFSFKDKPSVTWINIDGIHQLDIISKLGNCFGLHPLLQEDIANTGQRPKFEDYEDYIFIVLKMIGVKSGVVIESEQVSIILGSNFVISFQERPGDVFDEVRERIRKNKSRIRKAGADYLAYSLIDAIVDSYYDILEKVGDVIEEIEEQLTVDPTSKTLQFIRNLKKEMVFLRKSIWPMRELTSTWERCESTLIARATRDYLRNLHDHTIQIIDTIESYRDIISGMFDIYLSSLSNKMNEVMKVLAMFASIFIPLTFIAGIYGMNFHFMPELDWEWGYYGILLIMLMVGIGMLIFFKRKKWL